MSIWLPGITIGIGRGERQKEYLAAMEKLVAEEKRKLRNDAIEECAQVAENNLGRPATIPAAIRALKDKA